jgi:hypothetical protein
MKIFFLVSAIVFLLTLSLEGIFAGDSFNSFNVDVNLSKGERSPIKTSSEDNSVWYELIDNNQLDVSNSSAVCPSNECKMTGYETG